ncbi:hypothetical protein FA13DRAFT_1734507 [Coprinellus micaceus]|uniref:Uncharacterized protein n=1 Tax=Coprinellus micaceus TaxID=71717 RepID=A0A4Y7T6Y6_COPMI|nr:hypothetical protein FA13DRAFT_1734507 [Coprinellus micaceus]
MRCVAVWYPFSSTLKFESIPAIPSIRSSSTAGVSQTEPTSQPPQPPTAPTLKKDTPRIDGADGT